MAQIQPYSNQLLLGCGGYLGFADHAALSLNSVNHPSSSEYRLGGAVSLIVGNSGLNSGKYRLGGTVGQETFFLFLCQIVGKNPARHTRPLSRELAGRAESTTTQRWGSPMKCDLSPQHRPQDILCPFQSLILQFTFNTVSTPYYTIRFFLKVTSVKFCCLQRITSSEIGSVVKALENPGILFEFQQCKPSHSCMFSSPAMFILSLSKVSLEKELFTNHFSLGNDQARGSQEYRRDFKRPREIWETSKLRENEV